MSQKQLAERAGLRLPSLSDYETGKTVPGGEALRRLAESGINPTWILLGRQPVLTEQEHREEDSNDSVKQEVADALTPYRRRIEAILGIIAAAPEERRSSILDDVLARAEELQRLDELERAVQELRSQKRDRGA